MMPANNPDLAVAQEWFIRLSQWLQQQNLVETLSPGVTIPKPGTSYLRFCLFGGNAANEGDEVYNSLVVLQAHLAEANNEIWTLTDEVVYKEDAVKHYNSLFDFVEKLTKESNDVEVPGLPVILHVLEALQSYKQSAHADHSSMHVDMCAGAINTLHLHCLKNVNDTLGNDHPELALRLAAAFCRTANILPELEVEAEITRLLPVDIPDYFADGRSANNLLYKKLTAIEALYQLANRYPILVSEDLPGQLLRKLLAGLPKNGAPVLGKKCYPATTRDAADLILVMSRLGEKYSEARDKAILPLRWASFYLQDIKTGTPYAFRFPRMSVVTPAPGYDCTRMYLALATYLRSHYSKLGANMSNVFTD